MFPQEKILLIAINLEQKKFNNAYQGCKKEKEKKRKPHKHLDFEVFVYNFKEI